VGRGLEAVQDVVGLGEEALGGGLVGLRRAAADWRGEGSSQPDGHPSWRQWSTARAKAAAAAPASPAVRAARPPVSDRMASASTSLGGDAVRGCPARTRDLGQTGGSALAVRARCESQIGASGESINTRLYLRQGWDSNPWMPCDINGFRDRPIRPLWHLAVPEYSGGG
jgi:hypothetical protein